MSPNRWIYKIAGIALLAFGLWRGLTMSIPQIPILDETWRNIIFHVPMWYVMMIMLMVSVVFSVMQLNKRDEISDFKASAAATVGVFFGLMGLATGIVWSRVTWGSAISSNWNFKAWWAWDPKQTSALVLILIYFGYFLLRSSIQEPAQRARISAVFNLFGAALIVPAFYLIPKFLGGLHPGSGEEGPLASLKSLGNDHRLVLYPTALGFLLIGFWLMELRVRTHIAEEKIEVIAEGQ